MPNIAGDSQYLRKFIRHHLSVGISSFIFILDKYKETFEFSQIDSNRSSITVVDGVVNMNFGYGSKKIIIIGLNW